jgi:hypothetical protein
MDVHVPSEHHQEGKQYSAEIEMFHFYSLDYENEMATVSVFMEAYDDAPPYTYLDKVICQWRRREYNIRSQCGLEPVESTYPGCFPLFRERTLKDEKNGNLREQQQKEDTHETWDDDDDAVFQARVPHNQQRPFKTVADIFMGRRTKPKDATTGGIISLAEGQ